MLLDRGFNTELAHDVAGFIKGHRHRLGTEIFTPGARRFPRRTPFFIATPFFNPTRGRGLVDHTQCVEQHEGRGSHDVPLYFLTLIVDAEKTALTLAHLDERLLSPALVPAKDGIDANDLPVMHVQIPAVVVIEVDADVCGLSTKLHGLQDLGERHVRQCAHDSARAHVAHL